ncbi:MAG: zf-TFIIB domain containing protein [Proteobacteria bacterium]|nr:MAG: zf-TFIIB domain containing protein [Pseudomonadota bacterium]
MQCPKCRGVMRTHNRANVHIEQCDNCRGIFLDYGELEALSQLQNQWAQQMPTQPVAPMMGQQPMMAPQPMMGPQPVAAYPAWGAPQPYHGDPRYYKKRGLMGMLFSS